MKSANMELRVIIEDMLQNDGRFVGMSRYVSDINFYWTMSIPTAAAGHGFIFINPEFWEKLDDEKRKSVVAHEIWHLILNHLERGQGYDQDSYNISADHVINLGMREDGFLMGPDVEFGDIQPCCDDRFEGMSTSQVYSIVYKEKKENPSSHKSPEGTPSSDQIEDLVKEALEGTGKDLAQQAQENQEKREQATQGIEYGDLPAGTFIILSTDVQSLVIENATYHEIFEKYLVDPLSGGKRTFIRPSRRQIKGGLRLKGKHPKRGRKNRLTHLVYALDVSGSITATQRRQFMSSARTLKKMLNPKEMTIILWDTSIVYEKVFTEYEDLNNIQINAGGGTLLTPVYQRVREINPEALVIFTDLQVAIPPEESWDTIWFVPSNSCPTHHVNYGNIYLIPEVN